MSSSGATDTSDTFEIVNVTETKEAQKTVDDISSPSVGEINYDCTTPETTPDTTTCSEDPQVICEQIDIDMDSVTKSEVICEKSDIDMVTAASEKTTLGKSNEVYDSTKALDEKKVEDECIISVDSDTSDLLEISDSSVDEGLISEERKNSILTTFESYVDKFDSWIEELDLSLGWVPDLEEVPATKWILDRLP